MMRWEEGIMRLTVDKLTDGLNPGEPLRVLNVGFGLGIVRPEYLFASLPCCHADPLILCAQIDTMFQSLSPSPLLHTVIEPHPSVLEHMAQTGWTTEERPNLRVLKGKWQDWVENEAIYEEGGFGQSPPLPRPLTLAACRTRD